MQEIDSVTFKRQLSIQPLTHSVLLGNLQITESPPNTKPPPKLSYRSALHKKVFFFAGSVWTLARTQGEVRGDQEPPGDTWRYPIPLFIYIKPSMDNNFC